MPFKRNARPLQRGPQTRGGGRVRRGKTLPSDARSRARARDVHRRVGGKRRREEEQQARRRGERSRAGDPRRRDVLVYATASSRAMMDDVSRARCHSGVKENFFFSL